ncbi:putative ABC-type transport system involved in lysophospholipase L1 biosynthesis, permease component [Saccharomonospora azurea NA-128]|uniref:ABC-type transport system involved in lysophospholipase L1 biosynthesis, permease component n=2 Tax=Saccharomonospora azurea TaxID=40988 RepID=H8GDY7_9PSEU|nr:putative ABC-type transport system involved in lysophospholipase L1 biosynthesis, permease component [Saccharomonospora azurea NA-128]
MHSVYSPAVMNVFSDFALGARLAFGAGRRRGLALLRTVFAAVGIGLAVAGLLLVFASFNGLEERLDRLAARTPVEAAAGEPAVGLLSAPSYFRERELTAVYLEPWHSDAPVPPGLGDVPAPGQAVVSPALADLLASQDGALLRPRFAELDIVGTIGVEGVAEPDELLYYVGDEGLRDAPSVVAVGGFGVPSAPLSLGPLVVVEFLAGAVLISPLLVLVASSSKLAGSEGERRLSAIRLVGAGAAQIRRIAAAETLVGVLLGMVLAVAFFFLGRPLVVAADLAGLTLYEDALVPPWQAVVAVALLTPAVAIGCALVGLRDVVVEPYGVVRHSEPIPRRGRWRILFVALGLSLFFPDVWAGVDGDSRLVGVFAAAGTFVLLIGVPVLLPWLAERLVRGLRGGPPSWQLGVRRLQMDVGTPARVVAGITVVLAAAVAIQTLVTPMSSPPPHESARASVVVSVGWENRVEELVRDVPGVEQVEPGHFVLDPADLDATERLRNAVAPLGRQAMVYRDADVDAQGNKLATLHIILGTACSFALLLSIGNLVVLASAQVWQRRRAFAALRAAGLPRGVLTRSLLWQNGIPVVVGVLVSSATGLGVAGLFARLLDVPVHVDWAVLTVYSVGAVIGVGVLTVAAVTALASVDREPSLRVE